MLTILGYLFSILGGVGTGYLCYQTQNENMIWVGLGVIICLLSGGALTGV